MKKMMLLASVVALAALMLAAAPAFAQDDNDNDFDVVFCDFDGDGDDDGDNCEFNNNDRDIFRNVGNVDVSPTIDISQDIDQDADSGDVSQPISVTGGGDNSIQTVGLQPTANTGNAQNATGILQAAPIVAVNNDDNNGFFDDGRFIRCDRDGDGNDDGDDCDDFDNGRVFCDRDGDGNDDGDDDCFVFDNDNDNDNDNVIIRDRGDRFNVGDVGNELEIEDVNANIDLSPTQNITGGGEINQTAIAVGD